MQLRESSYSPSRYRALAVVAVLLQIALAPQISIAGGTVNFMLALAIVLSLTFEPHSAVFIGFFSGLFFDLTSSAPVGLMSLLLTVTSFGVSSAAHGALGGLTRESVRFAVIAILAVNLLFGLCLFLMGVQTDLIWALFGHVIASTVLDALVAVLFLMASGSGSSQRGFSARTRPGRSTRYKVLK